MGLLSVDLLITLQILPVFFSNCLFLALYDSVILLKHMVLFLSRSKSARGEWRRMLTSEGLRCVWNSFLLDAYKQVGAGRHRHGGVGSCAGHPCCQQRRELHRVLHRVPCLKLSLVGEVKVEGSSACSLELRVCRAAGSYLPLILYSLCHIT